jgi:type II secretory ATPase GspE/PulE/Tfp pilus assembly ATPase PilB-like protein
VDCKVRVPVEQSALRALGGAAAQMTDISQGAGCPACRGTGYRGRLGIFELLLMSDALREELLRRRGAAALRALAVAAGMRTLRDDGVRLVMAGRTTPEQVLRVTRA